MTKIEKLLIHPHNIFTVQDLSIIWNISNKPRLWNAIRHYLRVGKLLRVHKGVYAKTSSTSLEPYTSFELGQKLLTPSYISFYTALANHGIIFQFHQGIHLAALVSKTIKVNKDTFIYHKIKDAIFYDSTGIKDNQTHKIAEPERAICDSLYLFPNLSFDNLDFLDPEKLLQVSAIYHNHRLAQSIKKLIKIINK